MNYLVFIQNLRLASASAFDAFMLGVSKLGEPLVTFLLLAFVYWCVNKRTGQLMAFNVSFASWLNQWSKKIFKIERPWVRDARITPVESAIAGAGGYSMPSGHSTRATATWGSLGYATYLKGKAEDNKADKWLSLGSLLLVLLILFSRNYLGVHTIEDVIVAFVVGVAIIIGVDYLLSWVEADKEDGIRDIIVCVVGCVALILPMFRFGCLSNAGAGYGFIIGWILERRFVRFDIDNSANRLGKKILRFIPGALVVFVCFTSGTALFTHLVPERYAGFFLQGFAAFFIMFLYPVLIRLWDNEIADEKSVVLYKKIVIVIILVVCLVGVAVIGLKIGSHYGEIAHPETVAEDITEVQNEAVTENQLQAVESDAAIEATEPTNYYDPSAILSKNVKVIAHRGYSGIAPENTMASFERAIDIGADYIELDVQLTKDNVIVIFHDTDMARITGVSGEIGDYTYEELCALDAGSWFNAVNTGMSPEGEQANYSGEKIPTLKEALELIAGSDLSIYLELKDISASKGLTEEQLEAFATMVSDEVDSYGMTERVVYASFNYNYLRQIKDKNSFNRILCNTSIGDADVLLNNYPSDYYGINAEVLSQDTIAKLHEGGATVYIWTVNTPSQMRQVIKLGADGIVTNYPGIANVVVHDEYKYLADNYVSSVVMPGLYDYTLSDREIIHVDDYKAKLEANQEQPWYSNYVVQGFTKAGGFLVVSAYSYGVEKNSILYILNTSGRLLNIVDLGFVAHTGGIAYDEKHDILWVTAANGYVNALRWSDIIGGAYAGSEADILTSFDAGLVNHNDSHVASFLTYSDSKLYVGSYCNGVNGKLNEYDITDPINPVQVAQYDIPERIQGVTFAYDAATDVRTMILTQGYNTDDAALLSVKWEEGRMDYSVEDNRKILPEGAEQPLMTSAGLYILFESSARVYRHDARCVSDQIWLIEYR